MRGRRVRAGNRKKLKIVKAESQSQTDRESRELDRHRETETQ